MSDKKREMKHRLVPFFEDAPCYEKGQILKLHELYWNLEGEKEEQKTGGAGSTAHRPVNTDDAKKGCS